MAKNDKTLNIYLGIYRKSLKEKSMDISFRYQKQHTVQIEGNILEQRGKFKYLGLVISEDGKTDREIEERISKGDSLFGAIKNSFLGNK